jgi:GTP-binding protein
MIPVIALVGRPNVGKSTLFNCLTRSRDALVAEMPGMTRDRQFGQGKLNEKEFIVVDTGGIGYAEKENELDALMEQQTRQAILESDIVLMMVDARDGLTAADQTFSRELHKTGKTIHLVMNKIDGLDHEMAAFEFHALGFGNPFPIAASHKRGTSQLLTDLLETHVTDTALEETPPPKGVKLAIIGKPNVGKSTLTNRLLGEDRVIVCDLPGTTRDSIFIPLEHHGKHYTLIDTAGIRRRKNVDAFHEKISIIKSLQAIETANVILMMIDAQEGISEHDMHLLGFVLESGRSLVLCINKWDGLDIEVRDTIKSDIDRRLAFVDFAELFFISALHGTNVGHLFQAIDNAYASANCDLSTNSLTKLLELAVTQHPPPLVNGRRIKCRYANPGGHNPPVIVVHGNQVNKIPVHYKRYLINFFREKLKLVGTPVRIEYKVSDNPFKEKKNKLTTGQYKKRQRLIKLTRKKK